MSDTITRASDTRLPEVRANRRVVLDGLRATIAGAGDAAWPDVTGLALSPIAFRVGQALYHAAVEKIGEGLWPSFSAVCCWAEEDIPLLTSFVVAAVEGGAYATHGFVMKPTLARGRIVGRLDVKERCLVITGITANGAVLKFGVENLGDLGGTCVGMLALIEWSEDARKSAAANGIPFASVFTQAELGQEKS